MTCTKSTKLQGDQGLVPCCSRTTSLNQKFFKLNLLRRRKRVVGCGRPRNAVGFASLAAAFPERSRGNEGEAREGEAQEAKATLFDWPCPFSPVGPSVPFSSVHYTRWVQDLMEYDRRMKPVTPLFVHTQQATCSICHRRFDNEAVMRTPVRGLVHLNCHQVHVGLPRPSSSLSPCLFAVKRRRGADPKSSQDQEEVCTRNSEAELGPV
jgi:hypothetical protein